MGAVDSPYGVTTSSLSYLPVSARDQGVTLTQKKSNSQSDLAGISPASGPQIATGWTLGTWAAAPCWPELPQELYAGLQGLYQAASRSEYLADYLENYGRKASAPPRCPPRPLPHEPRSPQPHL